MKIEMEIEAETKLDKKTKIIMGINIFQIILSIYVSIAERSFEWAIIAMLWTLITIDNYYMSKIKTITDLIIKAQEKLIITLFKKNNELMKGENKEEKTENTKTKRNNRQKKDGE